MVENPVFDFKIKHVPSVHGCGDEQFCGAWNLIINKKYIDGSRRGNFLNDILFHILKHKDVLTLKCFFSSVIFL